MERGRVGVVLGTRISKVSRLNSNVESKIMICLWHTVFEKKRRALSKIPDKSLESEINLSKSGTMHKL